MTSKVVGRLSPEKNLRIVCEDEEENPFHMKFIEGVPTEDAEEAAREAIQNFAFKFRKEYDIIDETTGSLHISPNESLLKKGSIYLASKERTDFSFSKSRPSVNRDKVNSYNPLSVESSSFKYTKGVTEIASEKLDKSHCSDRSLCKATEDSIVKSHLNIVIEAKHSINTLTYDKKRLAKSKLEQIYTNSLLYLRQLRQDTHRSKVTIE